MYIHVHKNNIIYIFTFYTKMYRVPHIDGCRIYVDIITGEKLSSV